MNHEERVGDIMPQPIIDYINAHLGVTLHADEQVTQLVYRITEGYEYLWVQWPNGSTYRREGQYHG